MYSTTWCFHQFIKMRKQERGSSLLVFSDLNFWKRKTAFRHPRVELAKEDVTSTKRALFLSVFQLVGFSRFAFFLSFVFPWEPDWNDCFGDKLCVYHWDCLVSRFFRDFLPLKNHVFEIFFFHFSVFSFSTKLHKPPSFLVSWQSAERTLNLQARPGGRGRGGGGRRKREREREETRFH